MANESPVDGLYHHLKCELWEKTWRIQRQQLLEPKWERNRAAFKRQCDYAGENNNIPWAKPKEGYQDWQSLTVSDLTKTKTIAGKVHVCDIMLRGGQVQYMLTADEMGADPAGQPSTDKISGEGSDPVTKTLESHKQLIDRQLEACGAVGEFGRGVLYGSMLGETWLKVSVIDHVESHYAEIAPGVWDRKEQSEPWPAVAARSPWNMYWDLEGGPRDGEGCMEEEYISKLSARGLKRESGFIPAAIDEVLNKQSGSAPAGNTGAKSSDNPKRRENQVNRRNIWRGDFWATITLKQALAEEKRLMESYSLDSLPGVELYPATIPEGMTDEDVEVEVFVVMFNETVVRYSRAGSKAARPYYRCVWEDDPDGHGGISVADNVESETITLTKLTRALEDVSRITSRIILAGRRSKIDGDLKINVASPDKFIELTEDCKNVSEALQQIQLNAPVGALLEALSYFLQAGDYASNIPRVQSGHQSENPQTWSEMRERLNRSDTYMGDVFTHYDELSEDVLGYFLDFNMTNNALNIPRTNMKVKALGFTAYMNRVVKLQAIYDLLDRILNSDVLKQLYKVSPLVEEAAKASDIEPALFKKTQAELSAQADREMQQLQAQQSGAKPASAEELQAQMAKVQVLLAELDKKHAEVDLIRTKASAVRAEAAQKLVPGAQAPPVVPAAQPQPAESGVPV